MSKNGLSKLTLVGAVFFGLAVASAYAEDISYIGITVGPGPAYTAGSPGEWNMPGNAMTNGTVLGTISTYWEIAPISRGGAHVPGTFDWSGSQLTLDLNPGGPQAHGQFAAGGTLILMGEVYDPIGLHTGTFLPGTLHDGVILEASISSFEFREPDPGANELDLVGSMTITPTGGYLVTNSHGIHMVGDYFLNITLSAVQQMGGPLTDFSQSITYNAGTQVNLVQVPEPASVLLMVCGWVLLRRRR